MFYVSNIYTEKPHHFCSCLQKEIYQTLEKLNVSFERVDTDEAITMNDCIEIDKILNMKMVKTLFLCNRQQTEFYLFVTQGDKIFKTKEFSNALGISRVSFAPSELMEKMLGTKVGAATVLSILKDKERKIKVVFDKMVVEEEWYGCSDGTTRGYMKVKTDQIINTFLPYTNHDVIIIST